MWVVVTWGRKSYLGPAEISCCVLLFKFKDGGHRMSLRFHLFVSDVNRRTKILGATRWMQDFLTWSQGWKGSSYIFCELLRKNVPWKWSVKMCGIEKSCLW